MTDTLPPAYGGTLAGIAVLVTRPQPQADQLAATLAGLGATAFVFPALAICENVLTPAVAECISELDRYAGVICISAHAADIGLRLCAERWPQWPLHQTWYAVGPASGKALTGQGLDLVVAPAGSRSETLLALPALQQVDGQRFLILRGNGGREALAETLRSRGASVDYLELYRRESAHNDPAVLENFLASGARSVVVVTSGDSLDHLLVQAGTQAPALLAHPLVVVSGRLAEHAAQRGFRDIHTASGANDQALVQALLDLSSTRI